jgi:hypothetical protein
MSLCEALHGRWPELELPWEPMGSSLKRGERGKQEGRGGTARGWRGGC